MHRILFLVFTICALPAVAQPTVRPSGVCVIHDSVGEGYRGLVPFRANKRGTILAFIVDSSDASIIRVDTGASEIALSDNKGTNLIEKKKGSNHRLFSSTEISEDKKACLLHVNGNVIPGTGVSSIVANGVVVLHTGSLTEDLTAEPCTPEDDAEFMAGDMKLVIHGAGEKSNGFYFSIKSYDDKMQQCAGATYFDEDGSELKFRSLGATESKYKGGKSYIRSARFEKTPTGKVTVKLQMYSDFKEWKVPVALNVGLGS